MWANVFAHIAVSSKNFFVFARFFEQNSEQTPFRQLFLLDVSKKSEQNRLDGT
jgi:hypothetical protein